MKTGFKNRFFGHGGKRMIKKQILSENQSIKQLLFIRIVDGYEWISPRKIELHLSRQFEHTMLDSGCQRTFCVQDLN